MGLLRRIVEDRFMGVLLSALVFVLTAGAPMPVSAQQITIDGSTGMIPLATDLVQAFKAKSSSVPIELRRGSSSAAAIRGVADGRINIGLSSDPAGDAERASGLQSIEIARTAVVFGVHSSVNVPGLTPEQICNIYSGTIKNWKDVGGPSLSIMPLTRPSNEADPTIVRRHLSCFKEGSGVVSLPKAGDMAKALASKAGAIGITNSSFVEDSNGAIRPLTFNGISPTLENVQGGSYPFIRRFYLITQGGPTGGIGQFVAFVKSAEGQQIIRQNKAVPVK